MIHNYNIVLIIKVMLFAAIRATCANLLFVQLGKVNHPLLCSDFKLLQQAWLRGF